MLDNCGLAQGYKVCFALNQLMQEPERCAGDVGANEHLLPKWHCRYTRHKMQTSLNPIFWNHTWWLYIKMKLKKAEKTGRPGVAMWPGQSLERPAAASTRPHFPIRGQPACSLCRLPATTLPQLGCLQGLNLQGPTGQKGPQGPPGLLCPCRPWAL